MEVDQELQTVTAEQRRELTAALAAEVDHDFAFKLQMEEAMKASLSAQPSSSSSLSHQIFDCDLPNDDDVSNVGTADILAEEIEKFEQYRSDRELVEAEMRRVRDDLSRRIHDQAFARDIVGVPEEEWKKTGNYLQKPYGEGTSATADGECFSLYCKGLANEETVGGAKKILAAIGVAICGPSTEVPIFEVRKALVGGETSGEIAEVKALIEGLNAAVTLGLKRIAIFCDDNSLYQYVTGKWVAGEGKIATLVDQVTLLLRKFTLCSPNLVEKKDRIIHAYELARDAIISQVTPQPEGSSGIIYVVETCLICLEDREVSQMLSIDNCKHRFCLSCMEQHVEAKLLQGLIPRCPHEGCKFELQIECCRKFLTPELLDIMSQRIKEASIPVTQKLYCPYPKCSALMSKTEVLTSNATGCSVCSKCARLFCMKCKVPWHRNMTCSEYKGLHPYPCPEDAKLKSLAIKNSWRQCVKCNHMIELKYGCYHIYCRCGYEFCYTCGAEWKNKKPTCKCRIWDERNIVYAEQNRNR